VYRATQAASFFLVRIGFEYQIRFRACRVPASIGSVAAVSIVLTAYRCVGTLQAGDSYFKLEEIEVFVPVHL
jgi:hypothetical protein